MKVNALTSNESDENLLQQMLADDGDAFEALYDRRHAGVYRYALRMTGSPALAEDITQDVFLAFMRDAQQFDVSRGTIAGYLFGITRHRVLRKLERERSFVSIADDEDESSPFAERFVAQDDPLLDLARAEMAEIVRQAVLALPAHYREVVVLCNLEEMSYEQAAETIGCPVGTVRSRLNRARAMLTDKLRSLQHSSETSTQSLTPARCEI